MGRWEPNARGRLEQAALALYGERGFDNTTVAEIAERAGLTERTFFRHFSDKREVLFWGAGTLQELLVSTLAGAPRAQHRSTRSSPPSRPPAPSSRTDASSRASARPSSPRTQSFKSAS